MFDLDFAFFHMVLVNKKGLAYRKFFLDRLTPILFSPRLEKIIKFHSLGVIGGNILLPLGQNNWELLEPDMKNRLLTRSMDILHSCQVPVLAVDRRLRNEFLTIFNHFPLIFGDNFIKTLTSVLVKQYASQKGVKKIIITGEIPGIVELLEDLGELRIPISIQNEHPSQSEIMAYHLLYEKGIAVSTSYICPSDWEKGDLVILLESRPAPPSAPAFVINLAGDSAWLAPELAGTLESKGLDTSMNTLAPILESCLWAKAGFADQGEEPNNAVISAETLSTVNLLNQVGEDIGLWDFFLDKDI